MNKINVDKCKDCIYYDPVDDEHGECTAFHTSGEVDPTTPDTIACDTFSR